ncbi:MAG: hypothetical protein JXR49_13755 [Acidobacteria bacterium]|nr:hypothetical protein [Acidobacteriota bacterium]
MDRYLAAVVKHDPAAVPLAGDVKLVENTAATPIGKGLWKTATGGPADFKIDEAKGLVFAFSIFRHDGEPEALKITGVPGITELSNEYGVFDLPAAHVFKIRNGRIHEIEAIGYIADSGITNGWERDKLPFERKFQRLLSKPQWAIYVSSSRYRAVRAD